MKDGSVIILFANGNVYKKLKGSDEFITTNNKGLQSLSVNHLNSTPIIKMTFLAIEKKTI